jgi:hypothetical protein
LTKEFCEQALADKAENRNVSRSHVDSYRRDMLSGTFRLNGEPMVFDRNNRLTDGQHRCVAFLKAAEENPNVVVHTMVVYGVEPGLKYNMSRVRSVADQWQIDGISQGKNLSALCRLIQDWDDVEGFKSGMSLGYKLTYEQGSTMIQNDPSIREAVSEYGPGSLVFGRGPWSFLAWLFLRVPGGMSWLYAVADGAELEQGSPALVLRQWALNLRLRKNTLVGNNYIRNKLVIAAACKTWNATVTGQRIGVMRPAADKTFPVPIGLRTRNATHRPV